MQIDSTEIGDVKILTPRRFSDDRGYFSEVWNKQVLAQAGIHLDFVQDNHSYSAQKGTIRGLHYQNPPFAQDKLVRVARGSVLDVAVDIRNNSPSYGKWVSVMLSAENARQLLVPIGFLHGFVTLEAETEVLYKCSNFYAPECDRNIRFDDPDINIDWGIPADQAVLSQKDNQAPFLKDVLSPFEYEG